MVSGREGHASLTGWNTLRILLLRETKKKKRQLTVSIVHLSGLGENKPVRKVWVRYPHFGVGKKIRWNYPLVKPAGSVAIP